MRGKLLLLVMLLMTGAVCLRVTAQTINLPGKVLDQNGDPVAGASVRVQGQRGGVVTKTMVRSR